MYNSAIGNKKVSVLIPVYNAGKYLAEAIESVIRQTVPPYEIIVVDDGSTDNTKAIAREFQDNIQYLYRENAGPAAARNVGLRKAKGEYIAFQDADDLAHPQKLENLIQEFDSREDLGVALGLIYRSQFNVYEDIDLNEAERTAEFSLVLGAGLMKKSLFEEVGNFDEDLILGDDTDWFFRVREKDIPISVQQNVVLYYRLHDHNLTKNRSLYKQSLFRILKKSKDRKEYADVVKAYASSKFSNNDEFIEMWDTVSSQTDLRNE